MTPHGLHAPSSVTSQQLNNRKHPKAAASTLLYITGGYIRAASCILYGYHNLTHILCHAMGERCSYATLRWHWCTQTRARAHTRLSSILDRHISAHLYATPNNALKSLITGFTAGPLISLSQTPDRRPRAHARGIFTQEVQPHTCWYIRAYMIHGSFCMS